MLLTVSAQELQCSSSIRVPWHPSSPGNVTKQFHFPLLLTDALLFYVLKRQKNLKADQLMVLDSLCFLCLSNWVVVGDWDELTTNEGVIQRYISL